MIGLEVTGALRPASVQKYDENENAPTRERLVLVDQSNPLHPLFFQPRFFICSAGGVDAPGDGAVGSGGPGVAGAG